MDDEKIKDTCIAFNIVPGNKKTKTLKAELFKLINKE